MRAVVYDKYGPPSVLRVAEVAAPQVRAGEILIRVRAAEVTKTDCELRSLRFAVSWFAWPLRLVLGWRKPRRAVLGMYLSGEVAALGEGTNSWQVGQAVLGCSQLRLGAYGQFVAVPQSYTFVPKPNALSFEQAASLVLGGLNALHFMRKAQISPGQRVLILGAGGSIGLFALQLAKHFGAHVTAVDTTHKLGLLRELGADAVVDFTQQDALSGPERYHVVFSSVAAPHYARCLAVLEPGGCYLTANPTFRDLWRAPWTNLRGQRRVVVGLAQETREELETLSQMLESGALRTVVDSVFTPEQIAEAHRRVETEQRLGCVVLTVP